ncbi:hypothetical protein PMAA_004040 [Talaromyces marneffei ATCC 18224]|uniref:Uncharacterized protein n=1 Tax=Talaromyces marneffei (strain ATCC 18224 / CBS 334.59 / QM 7333) TaxID=441960 RepID=B6QT71_TALMQ|nr:hypothetical protein PMAA_004040 [Talaromyces marneffei ATCC 18224]
MNSAFSDVEDHSQDTSRICDAWVLGAAQWILWNGQQLFKLVNWREELGTSSALVERHRDENGNPIPKKHCWDDWKRGFEQVVSSGAYGEECVNITYILMSMFACGIQYQAELHREIAELREKQKESSKTERTETDNDY